MRTELTPLIGADARLAGEWEELAAAAGSSPFARIGFVKAWASTFAPRSTSVFCVRDRGRLRAVMTMRQRRGALISVPDCETALWEPVLDQDVCAQTLLEPLLTAANGRLTFSYLPNGGHSIVTAANERGLSVTTRSLRASPIVETRGSWGDFVAARLARKLTKNTERCRRRLSELGELRYRVYDGSSSLEALLTEGFSTELTGWKGRQGSAVMSRPDVQRFYWEVARWAAEEGMLRLHFLQIGERTVAFACTLEHGRTAYGLKLALDEEYRQFAPGIILLHQLLQRAFETSSVDNLQMCGESESYKLDFATGSDDQVRIDLWASAVRGLVGTTWARCCEAARRELGRHVPIERRVRFERPLARALHTRRLERLSSSD